MELWTCKKCGRKFSRKNQPHTCTLLKPEDHIKNKPNEIQELYKTLVSKLNRLIPVRLDAISFAINMKGKRNFGMLFISNRNIKVEFHLNYKLDDPRIVKSAKYNKKCSHIVYINKLEDINDQLLYWIVESFESIGIDK